MITKLYIRAEQALIDFTKDQRGVTAIEYAVLGVAVAAAVTAVFAKSDAGIKGVLQQGMTAISTSMSTAVSGAVQQ